jgi:D-beta-D-heptose 7-phosphate kinase/D-beta-D-heptose 1-phosphate adenosyltransferase
MLVVGLNSDSSIENLSKGDDRPINKLEHRVAVLSAMECVDYVVAFEESNPGDLIQEIKPDVLIKGQDWEGKEIVGQTFVEANGGRVVLLSLVEGLSTTELMERIRKGGS